MELGLAGQIIVITGASQGIGVGLAEVFAEEGCRLRLIARSAANLAKVGDDLRSRLGAEVETMALDLCEAGAIAKVVDFAGTANILVNNAGAIPGGNLWQVDEAAWRAGWELKVFGYINMVRAFYTLMKARGSGIIL